MRRNESTSLPQTPAGRKLGVPGNHIFHWYNGIAYPNDELAKKLVVLLKADPIEIITCANYYRVLESRKQRTNPRKHAERIRFWG